MQPNRIKYYLLGLFITGMILFVVLQFNSSRNIRKLISGNEQLLHQLNVKNELQRLQTNMARTDSKVRGTVISQDSLHITGIEAEIAVIKSDLREINKLVRTDSTEKLLTQLNYLVEEKNDFNVQVLDTFYAKGKHAAEHLINNQRGKRLSEAIINIIYQLDTTRQTAVNKATHLIDTSGQRAQRWGTVLVILACLVCLLAFLYITSRIHRQEQLIDALDTSRQQEKKLAAVKDQFLANMSHEIRTPMNAIIGFTHLLQAQPLNQHARDYTSAISQAGQNLLDIINDILDISKIESGMMRIAPASFSVRGTLHGLYTLLLPKAGEKQLQLYVTVDETVPDILYGDVTRLTQILVNLTNNAIKFTDSGTVQVAAKIMWQEGNAVRILFTVSDTGIGIPPADIPAIFDRFNQLEAAASRRYGGTGLGLTIVKQLVELQNGFISVESEPGEGTTFKVELPYTLGRLETAHGEHAYPTPAPLQPHTRILVVEDNRMNQDLLRHLLSNWKLQYQVAANGAEALEILASQSFDLVLMDIQMPEMDGYTAVRKLREELHSNIPVIAMTAHAMAGEREKCLQHGMNEYIAKPIDESTLYRLIQLFTGTMPVQEPSPVLPSINGNGHTGMINMQYLQELSKGESTFVRTMLEQFITELPEDITILKTAIQRNDTATIRSTAHHLKTTVSFIGLEPHLYPVLEQLESLTDSQYEQDQVYAQFERLRLLCAQALQEAVQLLL